LRGEPARSSIRRRPPGHPARHLDRRDRPRPHPALPGPAHRHPAARLPARTGAVRKLAGAGLWREQGHGAASRSAPEGWRRCLHRAAPRDVCRTAAEV